jgi:hypothetical protein
MNVFCLINRCKTSILRVEKPVYACLYRVKVQDRRHG